MLTVRPKVTELQFQLYGRTLHPELFTVYRSKRIERGKYQARIDITSAGHVVTWQYNGLTLTEVAAAANHPLPERRRLLKYRLHGERTDRLECRGDVTYQVGFQLEPVDPVVFWSFQKEITRHENRDGMLQIFNSSGRMAMGAVSYMNIETRQNSLLVQAFHTFPDDCAIVKVQSLFKCPAA